MNIRTLFLFLSLLLFTGRAVSMDRKLRLDGVESVRLHGLSGADLQLRIANSSGYTLRIDEAEFSFYSSADKLLGMARLQERVEIPRRKTTSVRSRWRFDRLDLATGMLLYKQLTDSSAPKLQIEGRLVVRLAGKKREMWLAKMPLSEFLSNFALE